MYKLCVNIDEKIIIFKGLLGMRILIVIVGDCYEIRRIGMKVDKIVWLRIRWWEIKRYLGVSN